MFDGVDAGTGVTSGAVTTGSSVSFFGALVSSIDDATGSAVSGAERSSPVSTLFELNTTRSTTVINTTARRI